ncbi:ABC transporter ATP-binding protein [Halobaculum lipolyticum]|uniref:ABC transporter ATP-binding protein n=1 Tax=Halobaculum lipolyticum TaxID=3032001 RepID=A0ABD5W9I0_9EURY|nr:ABC transporter ATP-binding protein [Halobaculum sp. DT31]
MAAITIDSLRKEYGDTVAVDGLSLSVDAGEVFGFLGPNGAGKSTTIDALLGHVRPTAGSVTVLGRDATTESRAVRESVGVLPDGYALYDRLTAREHVAMARSFRDADDDPDAVLARVGLADAADRRAGGFSTGMAQRLALGMALVDDPDVLVFDEPSAGLDPTGIADLRRIVAAAAERGATVFFSSHDLAQVEAVCDRVAIVDDGRLVAVDSVAGLRERAGALATLSVAADPLPDPASFLGIDGVRDAAVDGDRLLCRCVNAEAKVRALRAVFDSGVRVTDVDTDDASLEDLFAAALGDDDGDAVEAVPRGGSVATDGREPASPTAPEGVR